MSFFYAEGQEQLFAGRLDHDCGVERGGFFQENCIEKKCRWQFTYYLRYFKSLSNKSEKKSMYLNTNYYKENISRIHLQKSFRYI